VRHLFTQLLTISAAGLANRAMKDVFSKYPLAFFEEPEEEMARIQKLKQDDPITVQDIVNTSRALVEAARESDVEELKRIVNDAIEGEFLQAFTLQAFVVALKSASLEIVRTMIDMGMPLCHEHLEQSIHLVCEITTKENFSDAWRIVELLCCGGKDGSRIDVNLPRPGDGWTPLCIACAMLSVPLAYKLLELGADPNVVTCSSDTPLSLLKNLSVESNEEQQEAKEILINMLLQYGGVWSWRDAIRTRTRPRPQPNTDTNCAIRQEAN